MDGTQPADGRVETGRVPWAALLPLGDETPLLAVGLAPGELLRLAMFWPRIRVCAPERAAAESLMRHVTVVAPRCRFEPIGWSEALGSGYQALAIGTGLAGPGAPEAARDLVGPGGAAVWSGTRRAVPGRTRLLQAGFGSVRRHALLPPSRPKLAIPLGTGKAARAGLALYTPGKWRNRTASRLAWLASAAGLQGFMGRRLAVTARKPGAAVAGAYLLDWLSQAVARDVGDAAVYVGEEKLTLQLLDEASEACGIAKLAETAQAAERLAHEAAALTHLAGAAELRSMVPALVASAEWHGHRVTVQTGVGTGLRRYATAPTPAHMQFLLAMSRTDRREGRLEDWPLWPAVLRWSGAAGQPRVEDAASVREAVQRSRDVLGSVRVPFHRVHGDFAPWNIVLCARGLTVVDWEASQQAGLPLFDLVHFAVRVGRLIKGRALSLPGLLAGGPAALGVGREIAALAASFGYTPEQTDALVRLCLIAEAMERATR